MSGFVLGIEIVVALILLIIVFKFQIDIVTAGRIETGGVIPPTEQVKCKTKSDCSHNELCLSIDYQSNFCGCLDDGDCLPAENCVYNRCS